MLEINLSTGDKLFFDGNVTANVLKVPVETELKIFKKAALKKTAFSQDQLGMFTMMSAGRDGKVRFGSFSTPKAVLKGRSAGCTWNPNKCGIEFSTDEITLCDLEFQQELCVDALWNSCWEKLLEIGTGIHDISSTPESAALLAEVIEKQHMAIGNSYHDVATFGGHPLITQADSESWYQAVGTSEKEWKCFYDQMINCSGYITVVDGLKAAGHENFNVQIFGDDVSGSDYTGSAMALFNRLIKAQPTYMKQLSKRQYRDRMIIGVTAGIFDRYEEELIQLHGGVSQTFYMRIGGSHSDCIDCLDGNMPGVLKYKGYKVVCMDEWTLLDDEIGTTTHRAMLFVPGVFGLGYDVSPLQSFSGMGMQISSWNVAPLHGKNYFWANFKQGTKILDENLITSASLITTP